MRRAELYGIRERWFLTPEGLREIPLAQRPRMVKDVAALCDEVESLQESLARSVADALALGEYVCAHRGFHRQVGNAIGTSRESVVWPGVCADCGLPLTTANAANFRNERPIIEDAGGQ